MKKIITLLLLASILVGISLITVELSPVYTIMIILGVVLIYSIFLKIIKPIWIIAIVFIIAPFIDILRATYFKNIPFMGVYQELIFILLLVSKLITTKELTKFIHLELIDYLIIFFVFWSLFQVIQSPSILGGFYVWRWYSIGPLMYLIIKLYYFTKKEYVVIISAMCIGLAAAAVFIFYQYFILGPEKVAQISQSLGFTAFYRIGWRLPGPFSSPLVASACYSILILFGMALLFIKRINWIGFCLIVIGGLAIVFTLSRSGVFIGLVGLIAVLTFNFPKIKRRILPAFLGILIILLFSYQIPETKQFLSYLTNTNLDSYDTDRIAEFSNILSDAIYKYPFGIGFAGGGAVSQQAYAMFRGDRTYMPKYLGGDSVFFATLQTSGFLGLLLLIAIYILFIYRSVRLLFCSLSDPERIMCLVALSFFLGTFVTLGNLIDVWPIKLYLWSFGAMIMGHRVGLLKNSSVNIVGVIAAEEPVHN
jgi:hypothetical protein